MATVYRYKNAQGGLVYSDQLPDPHKGERFEPSAETTNQCYAREFCGNKKEGKSDSDKAKTYISAARKHIPKLQEYAQVLNYLRSHDEAGFKTAMKELQQKNPRAWIELQKSPMFKNIAGTAHVEDGIKAATKIGTKPKDLENYKEAWYDRIKKTAQARGYVDSKPSLSAIANSTSSVRVAAGTAVSRVGGTVLQFALEALKPETGTSGGAFALRFRLDTFAGHHPGWSGKQMNIADPEYAEILGFINTGDYRSAKRAMDTWEASHR